MKILIVYDSIFGNTMKIAKAIKESLKGEEITLGRPKELKKGIIGEVDAIIAGSPTRAFKPTKKITKFLNSIHPKDISGKNALAFDTRISKDDVNSKVFNTFEKMFGYAGDSIEKILAKKGAIIAASHEGFCVKESEGPLKDGELDRAEKWAKLIKK